MNNTGGLFAEISSTASIKNVHLRELRVKDSGGSSSRTGGLTDTNNGEINNCSVKSKVTGSGHAGD